VDIGRPGEGDPVVSGLSWTSSDPAIASVSTDEPTVVTALAAGHVTITAGLRHFCV
jgi:hypothetical protein